MKKNYIFGALVITLALTGTSCTNDYLLNSNNSGNGTEITIIATTPHDETDTRVSFDESISKVDVKWAANDKFGVWKSTGSTIGEFVFAGTEGDTSGEFTTTATYAENDALYAFYPQPTTGGSASAAILDLSTNQIGVLNPALHYMYASGTLQNGMANFNFKFAISVLKITLDFSGMENKPSVIKSVGISATGIYKKAKLNIKEDNPTPTFSEADRGYITTASDKEFGLTNNLAIVYLYVHPGDFTGQELKIVATDKDGSKNYITTMAGRNVVSGKVYTLTATMAEDTRKFQNEDTATGASEADAYEIADEKQLKLLADRVNGNGADAWNTKYYKLTADIDLSSICSNSKENWLPIGFTSNYAFKGHFDGNGKIISNIYIDNNVDYQGLFGCLVGFDVKGVTLEGTISGTSYVGGIAGKCTNGTISNCTNRATMVSKLNDIYSSNPYTGGIVGYASSTAITNCTNSASITMNGNGINTPLPLLTGGIAGCAFNNSGIHGCINTGNITATNTIESQSYTGGIAGNLNFASVNACYNTGNVSNKCMQSKFPQRVNSGGITGMANVVVLNGNYSIGKVTSNHIAGGIIGEDRVSTENITVFISNCMFLKIEGGAIEGVGSIGIPTVPKPDIKPSDDIAIINSGVAAMNQAIKTWNEGEIPDTWPPKSYPSEGVKAIAGSVYECNYHFEAGSAGNTAPSIKLGKP